ncbi:MAG: hypothetical protein ICV63_20615 [Coleofasciculus sp. Co-bin14]|nr:hypothetical protein [Coleofasciculus sp. Co-bin14]
MSGGIYLIQDNGQLVEMTEQAYDSEALLQKLLTDYPNLLAGDQINSTAPRQWLLISREMGVPSQEDGTARWAIDHLFLDQSGIPTLVEVKRSSDTRIRREVVGQMLDYAANGVVYWSLEKIRAQFEANCEVDGIEPEQKFIKCLGAEIDQEHFWQQVKTNLQAGKVRLVFVADEIPAELQRIVEFLNKQMNPAEVLAVEIKQYLGQGLRTLVPRVIGQTAEAQQKKSSITGEVRQWNEPSFFQKLEGRHNPDQIWVAKQIYDWVNNHHLLKTRWSKGKTGGFYAIVEHKGTEFQPVGVWTGARVNDTEALIQFPLASLKQTLPFDDETKRLELLHRLNNIPGVTLPPSSLNGYPYIRLSTLKEDMILKQLLEICDWVIQEIKAS